MRDYRRPIPPSVGYPRIAEASDLFFNDALKTPALRGTCGILLLLFLAILPVYL
jgi:hypothetical protein